MPLSSVPLIPSCPSSTSWFHAFLPLSNHKSQIRGSASDPSLPLPMGRVARIVPEFCARTTPRNGATPCAQRNNKFLARGVFYLLNCCTNAIIRSGSEAAPRQVAETAKKSVIAE
jgi:hypothetical protein